MANTISYFGFLDFQHQGGSQRTEELRQAWVASSDATPIFYGDPVQTQAAYVSTGLQNSGFGPYVTQATSATTSVVGVFRGCELYNATLQKMYYSRTFPGQSAAGTSSQTGDIKVYIQADRAMRFIVQASSGAILGASNIGNLMPVGASTAVNGGSGGTPAIGNPSSNVGNTTNGNSGALVMSSQATAISSQTGWGTTSSQCFQLVDFYSNWAPGLLPGQVPGTGTAQFVNGADNTTAGQWVIVQPWNWQQF